MVVQVVFREVVFEGSVITLHHLFEHSGRRDARKVRSTRCHGERQTKADQIVDRVADDGLVQVANLDSDLAVRACDRAEIADMAVAADPDRRPLRKGATSRAAQPLVELGCAASDKGMRRSGHLKVSGFERGQVGGRDAGPAMISSIPTVQEFAPAATSWMWMKSTIFIEYYLE